MRSPWKCNLGVISVIVFLTALLSIGGLMSANAQIVDSIPATPKANADTLSKAQLTKYKGQIRDLMSYLEYNLNLLGSDSVPIREKDIIINESYLKFFKDDKVQIEDDLDDNRGMVTNKDVQAYLKDVDFFFENVKFKFSIDTILYAYTKNKSLYFKVTLNRLLTGVALKGNKVSSNQIRFIELNLNRDSEDLKIVSIYTKGLSVEEDLKHWWNELSPEWKALFEEDIYLNDSMNMQMISSLHPNFMIGDTLYVQSDTILTFNHKVIRSLQQLTGRESLDLSRNDNITGLEPLKKFSNLKSLDISYTKITDLLPLRNLSSMRKLDISHTNVKSLDPLKYCIRMNELYLSNSQVSNLATVSNFKEITKLYGNRTAISNLEPLKDLPMLEVLQLSYTKVSDINPLQGNHRLKRLYLDSTNVSNIDPLSKIQQLEVLSIEYTRVSDLTGLVNFNSLKKLFCRGIDIDKDSLVHFSIANPNLVVIFAPDELSTWWSGLSFTWKQEIKKLLGIETQPTSEELHKVLKLESIDVSNNKNIDNLDALTMLTSLQTVNLSGTSILEIKNAGLLADLNALDISATEVTDLTPLRDLKKLKYLNVSGTKIPDIRSVGTITSLERLDFSNTKVSDVSALNALSNLKIVYADKIQVSQPILEGLSTANNYLVVYQTGTLDSWWEALPVTWRSVFGSQVHIAKEIPSKEELHQIISLKSLKVEDKNDINSLKPLSAFTNLRSLILDRLNISGVSEIMKFNNLEELKIVNCPIVDPQPVGHLKKLHSLTLKNTSIDDIQPVELLTELEFLDVSGTKIKSVKALCDLKKLKHLNISNTYVKSIKPLLDIPYLETLICFNTKISSGNLDAIRELKPNIKIEFY